MRTTGRRASRNIVHPFLTVEVSVFNEDWREMFFQAAAYLSETTGIQYHLMIFFDMQAEEFNMSIVLLEKVAPPRFYRSEAERKEAFDKLAAQFAQVAHAELDPEPVAKRTRGQLRTRTVLYNNLNNAWIRNVRPIDIEDFFGFRIAFCVHIDERFFEIPDDGDATYIGPEFQLPFPVATIFQGSGPEIIEYLEQHREEHRGQIVVVLDEYFFELAWQLYLELRNER